MTYGLLKPLPPEPEKQRSAKRPRVLVQAATEDAQVSDWGSLLGDLARPSLELAGREVAWRVHDKTHLEFAIDYPFADAEVSYTWEAFFFVPESFRLDEKTYDKKEMYDDLLSYVRLAVPQVPFSELAEREAREGAAAPILVELEASIVAAEGHGDGSTPSRTAIRRARTFASLVRANGLEAQRVMLAEALASTDANAATPRVAAFVRSATRVAKAYREVLAKSEGLGLPVELRVALQWVDEDLSLVLEALTASASVRLQEQAPNDPAYADLARRLAGDAVNEARYREQKKYNSVGSGGATARDVEHIEFRRHMLKRFTSSVLWLKYEVVDGNSWVLQALYAFAAAVAMAFAFIATQRSTEVQRYFYAYVFLVVASYAAKDRIKAYLQASFSKWAEHRFPNRRWKIRDPEREANLGEVHERAGFKPFAHLPTGVLAARRLTRAHALEEFARPETVLWHEKALVLRKPPGIASPMLTEIFRLNIGPWLTHTDDPNRTITFADPADATVYSAVARRVYNIAVVYRLRRGKEDAPWRRIRAVVSRKGIERIDPIV